MRSGTDNTCFAHCSGSEY